jgi:hypothetical protein
MSSAVKAPAKTAVAEHIRALRGSDTFVQSLSFGNFPFNALYGLRDEQFTSSSQFTSIWKFLIYSAVCAMMAKNPRIDELVARDLRRHFNIDLEQALSASLTRLTDRQGGFTIMGSGANASLKSVIVANDTPWHERVQALENIILQHLDTSRYFIIFDELDEDYRDIRDIPTSNQYFDLLYGLFKAINDVRRTFRERLGVFPIAFLREDIYAQLRDSDRNKWRDFALDLTWSPATLEQLLAYRISRAANPQGPVLPVHDALAQVFASQTVRVQTGPGGRRNVAAHILSRTLMRPRDVISWVREAANIADQDGKDRVTSDMFVAIDRAYSSRLRDEFIDEIHSTIPEIDEVFNAMSRMRKQVFSLSEFADIYDGATTLNPPGTGLGFDDLCERLFEFSVLGNQLRQTNTSVFKYLHPAARMNPTEKAVIHPGLLKALQIA